MRVAFFVFSFPALSETFILRQITGLMDLGHIVDIYAIVRAAASTSVHHDVERYGLLRRTTYLDMPNSTNRFNRWARMMPTLLRSFIVAPKLAIGILSSYGGISNQLRALYRLAVLAACRSEYDVVHAHFGSVANDFRFVKPLWQTPYVASFYGYDFSVWPQLYGTDVYKKLFDIADIVTVNSQYGRKRVQALGCPPDKVQKLFIGLDPDRFTFHPRFLRPGEPIRLLTVARLVEKKGLEYSIRAAAMVHAKYPNLRYDILGEGPLRPSLQKIIEDCELDGVVHLDGAGDEDHVRRLMRQAHIFVLASVTASDGDQEGLPLVIPEAQASGLPVVVTDHDGLPEGIVPNESGFVVPERDVAAMTERIQYLIANPALWPQMGRIGRQFAEQHFNIRNLSRQLVQLYEELIRSVGDFNGPTNCDESNLT